MLLWLMFITTADYVGVAFDVYYDVDIADDVTIIQMPMRLCVRMLTEVDVDVNISAEE